MLKLIKFLLILGLLVLPANATEYLVVKVVDGDTIYLDFNANGKADVNERIRLNGIDAFEVHNGNHLQWQMKEYSMTLNEVLGLGYFGREFTNRELYGKFVDANFTADEAFDKYNRPIMSITYDGGKSFEEEILKAGLATVYEKSNLANYLKKHYNNKNLKANLKLARKLKLGFYNYKTGEIYSINSEGAYSGENRLINIEDFNSGLQ